MRIKAAIKRFFRYRLVRVVIAVHIVLFVLSVAFMFHIIGSGRSDYESAMVCQPFDAVIVPGIPHEQNSWSTLMKQRVHWAVYLYESEITSNIIFSGGAVYTPYVESEIMKAYAVAAGVPEARVFAETKAEHSTENLHYSLELAYKLGFENVALATDPFQSYFLDIFAEKREIEIAFMPFKRSILENDDFEMPKIDETRAFVSDFVALPERQGFFERFRGTLGKNIKGKDQNE